MTDAIRHEGDARVVVLAAEEECCPICHRHSVPQPVYYAYLNTSTEIASQVEVTYRCRNRNCQHLYIGRFIHSAYEGSVPRYSLQSILPREAEVTPTPDLVATLSPTFVRIQQQALSAEANGYTDLTGIGLRKAFEFLVKDYAISQVGEERREEVLDKPIARCIEDYMDDPKLKAAAKRAAWLGNDETHYLRHWDDKDIDDLKALIRITVHWIEHVLQTARYLEEMPD